VGDGKGGWPVGFDWRRWWVGIGGALGDGEKEIGNWRWRERTGEEERKY
jgi:hypothetical protein